MAEFLGTLILILFGVGVVAQVVAAGIGDHDSITWAWGLGVALGVYVAARISGAHLNPAVTLALACFKGFSWRKVLPYSLAQTLGAFVAALLVRWNYTEALAKADPGHTLKTQGVFSTLPGNGTLPVSEWGALRDQVIGTALLVLVIFAVTTCSTPRPAPTSPRWSSACWWWRSAWPGARTPGTPSTRPATSGRAWPVTSPGTVPPGVISTATRTGGFPSSDRWPAG